MTVNSGTETSGLRMAKQHTKKGGTELRPFLKDRGEWSLLSTGAARANDTGFGGRAGHNDMIQMTEADMEMLADYEEEQ